jgi:hypothetical protein
MNEEVARSRVVVGGDFGLSTLAVLLGSQHLDHTRRGDRLALNRNQAARNSRLRVCLAMVTRNSS